MSRVYSLPFSIECNYVTHIETLLLQASSTALLLSTQSSSPYYAEAQFVIQGDTRLDEFNQQLQVSLVPTAINQT